MLPKIEVSGRNVLFSLKDLVLGVLVASVFWPGFFLICFFNVPARWFVQKVYNLFYPKDHYIVCDGEDGVFGTKIKGNCNSMIQGYQIIKGKPDLLRIREKFNQMFKTTEKDYLRFQYIFTSKFGYFCWEKHTNFDVRKHIRLLDNWDFKKEADERKIMDITGDYSTKEMSTDKPQWEVLLIPKYRVEGQGSHEPCDHYALITRFNHAYSDAISYFLMTNHYLADYPGELPMDPTKPFKVPLWAKAIIWGKVILLGPLDFVSIMMTYLFDKSVYRTPYYSDTKLVARSPVIRLDTIKEIKKASGASVTAILYTAVYSALYKSHVKLYKGEKVPGVLHLGSVMAMFPYWQNRKLGNQFTLWPYTAPLNIQDLKERLEVSNELTLRGVGSPGPVLNFYLTRALGSLPRILHHILWSLSGSPVMLSNVPGFNTRIGLYGGEMVDGAGFIPLMSTVGVGLSTQTYCGDLRFNAIVDPKVFPRRSDLQKFLNDVIYDIKELASIYGISENDQQLAIKNISNNNKTNVLTKSLSSDENNNNAYNKAIEVLNEKSNTENSTTATIRMTKKVKGKDADSLTRKGDLKKATEDLLWKCIQ